MAGMQIIRLRAEDTKSLLAQPESGMGFQIVEAKKAASLGSEAWLVFNGELAIVIEDQTWLQSRAAMSEIHLRAEAKNVSTLIESFHVATTRSGVGRPPSSHGPARTLAPAAHSLIKKSETAAGTTYYRFSAFENDRRVNPKTGAFLPGTYATTATDKPMAPSGFAAVGRYALPNVLPASFVFALSAVGSERIHIGTVAPAFGQSGGGVEVFFPLGGSNSAGYKAPARLPDE